MKLKAGKLVYFGHLSLEAECTWGPMAGKSQYGRVVVNKTSVSDDFYMDRTIFQEGFPKVYELYKDNVINAVKD